MDCASCRKTVKRITAVKCIPCNKCFHPSCIGRHKIINEIGQLVPCTGQSVELATTPTSPSTDVFVDASSAGVSVSATASDVPATIPPTTTLTSTTTTITTTSTTTVTTTGSSSLAAPRPSYRTAPTVVSTIVSPAPTTELSQLCANVRALVQSQNDIKTTLQSHTLKLNQCTEFIQTQRAHNVCMENAITSLTVEINGKLQALTENQFEVTSRVNTLEASIASLRLQVNEMQSRSNSACPPSVSTDTVKQISAKIHQIEQDQTACDLLISGLPEQRGENLSLLMVRVAEVLEVPLSVRDIVKVRRLPSNLSNTARAQEIRGKPRAIILRLCTASLKSTILVARRQKGRLSASAVSNNFTDSTLRINEFLPRDSWLLLKTVRAAARERGYKFSWHSRGSILVRKDADSSPIRISSEKDIDTMMP